MFFVISTCCTEKCKMTQTCCKRESCGFFGTRKASCNNFKSSTRSLQPTRLLIPVYYQPQEIKDYTPILCNPTAVKQLVPLWFLWWANTQEALLSTHTFKPRGHHWMSVWRGRLRHIYCCIAQSLPCTEHAQHWRFMQWSYYWNVLKIKNKNSLEMIYCRMFLLKRTLLPILAIF